MRGSSFAPAAAATQSCVATRNKATRNICESVAARVAALRKVISQGAPRGFFSRICEEMEWKRQRPSREVGKVEKFSVELLLAAVDLHEAEGRPDQAAALMEAIERHLHRPISTTGAIVIQMKDGQLLLNFAGGTE